MTGEPNRDTGAMPDASAFADASAGLLRARVVDPPRQPGHLASLDRFDILRVIGSGGMGVVLLARDSASGELAAIKVLRPELIDRADVRHRFLVEARHMERLSHPNILAVSEVSERPDGPYFVMPFVQRGSLTGLIAPGKALDQPTALSVASQIAEALVYAHAKGIIHRDLKPGNVLVDGGGHAWLTDFGLARRIDVNDSLIDVQRSQTEGTCPYMAPEVAEGNAGDTRCDIYSFGAMLYELLTGRRPYSGETAAGIIRQIVAGPPEPILRRNPQAHPGLVQIAKGAMARELRDRYASMADVVADLERAKKGEVPLGPHVKPPRAGFRRRAGIAIAIAAVCIAAILAAPWHFTHRANRTLLDEVFRGTAIDKKLWAWSQTHAFFRDGRGKNEFAVSQQDGSLLIEAHVEHESGGASVQDVWLDSLLDLRSAADNLLVDVHFSASAVGGGVAVMLTNGEPPQRPTDPNSVVLFRAFASGKKPMALTDQHVQIEILKAANVAVVGPADTGAAQSQLIDLPAQGAWKLRFYAVAATSAEFAPASVQLRLNHVTVSAIRPPMCIVGKVLDQLTNRPVQGVTVRAASIPNTVDTDAEGNFFLPVLSPGKTQVTATAKGYSSVSGPVTADVRPGRQAVIRIVLRKTAPTAYGDVEASIPTDGQTILGLAVNDRWLYFTARADTNKTDFCRMAHDGSSRTQIAPYSGAGGLAFAGGDLYGLARSPGQLCKVGPDGRIEKVHGLPVARPRGLAFDGVLFWFLEVNPAQDIHGAYAIDAKTGEVKAHFESDDADIRGIAAEPKAGGGRLWISSGSGTVYEIDPARIPSGGKLEAGVLRTFPGHYGAMSWYGGKLWGMDNEARRLCQIRIEPAP